MTFLSHLFHRDTASDHARALAKQGAEQRHSRIIARARQLRRELGLPPHKAFETEGVG